MTVIPVTPELLELVRQRKKVSTVRRGTRDYLPGPAVLRAGKDEVRISITEVEHTRLGRLSEQDARADGFSSYDELLSALRRFYPTIAPIDPVTVVRFSYP